ncbi:hypothetical protein CABS01_16650 [Colletotrichum abscissum]|uniref:uncharacterized protein n=1 Tax=Colletotrichum abscissum TaxID=1671311 RepID=UPI0027D6E3F3|nr:uncharacterized protein CABS01_16650 [Colletotrichum abscissum]KAK1517408.1 hypothetical protein CABS01_16650 [Colletotrichum abscissum]
MPSKKECDELKDGLDMLPVLLKRVQAILDFLHHSSNGRSLLSDSPVQNTIFCSLSRVKSEVKFLDDTIRRHLHCFSQPGRLLSVSPVYEPSSTQNSSLGPNAGKLVEAQACVLSVRLPSTSFIVTCREAAFSTPLNSTSLAETNASLTGVDRATSSMSTLVGCHVATKLISDKGWINFVQDDPLLVRFSEPFLPSGASAFAKGFDGMVLPINVNAADQMSDHNKIHWILAIVNWKTETFDAFGMQPTAFSRWSIRIDEYVSELRGAVIQLDKRSHELGPYWEDSCCAFLCAYAFERYLGRAPHRQERWPTGPALRKHYLRKLLNQWELPAGRRTKGPRHSELGGGPSSG